MSVHWTKVKKRSNDREGTHIRTQKMHHVLELMPYIPGQVGEMLLMAPSEPSTFRYLKGAQESMAT